MRTEVTALEQQAVTFSSTVEALAVVDAPTFERAGALVRAIAGYLKRVGEVMDPIVEAAHRAHKVAVTQRDGLLRPAQQAKRVLGERMASWEAKEARLRREAEEAAQRERERLECEARDAAEHEQRRLQAAAETARLEEAAALEAAGDGAGAVHLIEAPIAVPVVTPAPVFVPSPPPPPAPKISGVSFREDWTAEVVSLPELVRAVASGQQPMTLLAPNQVALNQLARALKGAMAVPGVRAVSSRTAAVRA